MLAACVVAVVLPLLSRLIPPAPFDLHAGGEQSYVVSFTSVWPQMEFSEGQTLDQGYRACSVARQAPDDTSLAGAISSDLASGTRGDNDWVINTYSHAGSLLCTSQADKIEAALTTVTGIDTPIQKIGRP
jgi:hypothetical protein